MRIDSHGRAHPRNPASPFVAARNTDVPADRDVLHRHDDAEGPAVIGRPAALATAAAIWAASLAHAAWRTEAGFWTLRVALTVMLAVWVVGLLRSRTPLLAASPLMIMAATALTGYSLVEALFGLLTGWEVPAHPPGQQTLAYVGSLGEALVLQFVGFCLLVTAMVARWAPQRRVVPDIAGADDARWTALAALAGVAILGMLAADTAAASLWRAAQHDSWLGKQLHDAVAPLTAVAFAALAHAAAMRGGRVALLYLGVAALYLGVKASFDLVQTPLMIVGTTLLYFLITRGRGLVVPLLTLAGAVCLGAVLLTVIMLVRTSPAEMGGGDPLHALRQGVYYKLVARQGVSAFCMNRMVSVHRADGSVAEPFYFMAALVPRVLWPDKPDLSLGHYYSVKFCEGDPDPKSEHYELVTLLAEPAQRGGWVGLAVAQGLIGTGLGLAALTLMSRGALGLIVLFALSPWLIHFQQSFGLYLANAVKMAIYMTPAFILLYLLLRGARSDRPAS